jgi:hypothetical protein
MQFSTLALFLLPLASVLAAPAGNSNKQALEKGIQANLNAGKQELAAVNNAEKAINSGASKATIQKAEGKIQTALNTAVADRKQNQKLAGREPANPTPAQAKTELKAGLQKVANAQASAQKTVSSLTGTKQDLSKLQSLSKTFSNGKATNENNLKLVSLITSLLSVLNEEIERASY